MLIDAMHTKWQAQWQCDGPRGWLERAPHKPPAPIFFLDISYCGRYSTFMFKCSNKTCRAPVEKKGYCASCKAEYRKRWMEAHPGYATQKRKEWALKNPERARELDRQKYERRKALRGPVEAKVREPILSAEERSLRMSARKIYKYAIRHGKLVRGPCVVCGETDGVDGHHTDYTKPLDVVWLCKPHHREEHRKLKCEAA